MRISIIIASVLAVYFEVASIINAFVLAVYFVVASIIIASGNCAILSRVQPYGISVASVNSVRAVSNGSGTGPALCCAICQCAAGASGRRTVSGGSCSSNGRSPGFCCVMVASPSSSVTNGKAPRGAGKELIVRKRRRTTQGCEARPRRRERVESARARA